MLIYTRKIGTFNIVTNITKNTFLINVPMYKSKRSGGWLCCFPGVDPRV